MATWYTITALSLSGALAALEATRRLALSVLRWLVANPAQAAQFEAWLLASLSTRPGIASPAASGKPASPPEIG